MEQHITLTLGTDYTVTGNTITLTEQIETESVIPIRYADKQIFVDYTYELTTVDPLGGLGDALIQAMNPVHIIYETLTNREWGRGLPRSMLGDESWRYAAEKCYQERFGLCLRWNRQDSIRSFIQSVLDHVGGTIYDNRQTGKIEINLIRGDYVKTDLRLFDKDNGLIEISEATAGSQGSMINEVRVTYRDPVTDEDRTVRATNLAALQAAGGTVNSTTKAYPGVPTAELAARLAKRDLKALSPTIRKFNITVDRRGYYIVPGSVIRVQDVSRGIPDMVLRVGTVDYGRLGDGRISIAAIQDVFGLPQRGYTTMGPPVWRPPTRDACIGVHKVFEMPYRNVYRAFSPADFSFIDETSGFAAAVCQEGQSMNAIYTMAIRNGAAESEDAPTDTNYNCAT